MRVSPLHRMIVPIHLGRFQVSIVIGSSVESQAKASWSWRGLVLDVHTKMRHHAFGSGCRLFRYVTWQINNRLTVVYHSLKLSLCWKGENAGSFTQSKNSQTTNGRTAMSQTNKEGPLSTLIGSIKLILGSLKQAWYVHSKFAFLKLLQFHCLFLSQNNFIFYLKVQGWFFRQYAFIRN